MAFFIPTSIQKRLLRYALSRIQLFDTDALELDSLDIGIGKRSNVELRDVALRKSELAKLLNLPPTTTIASAIVSSLRLIVPANLYSSSICIHVSGVKVDLKVDDEGKSDLGGTRAPPDSQDGRPHSQTPQYPKNGLDAEHENPAIPTPEDLAKSYLQSEPATRTAELEAELTSRSVDLQQSTTSSDIGDVYGGFGTGGNAVLPGFISGFFQGVADRLEIIVKDVELRAHTTIQPSPSSSNPSLNFELHSIPITLACQFDQLEVHGVTASDRDEMPPSDRPVDGNVTETHLGRRKIALDGFRIRIYCKPDNLDRFLSVDAKVRGLTALSNTPCGASTDMRSSHAAESSHATLRSRQDDVIDALKGSADLMNFPFVDKDLTGEAQSLHTSNNIETTPHLDMRRHADTYPDQYEAGPWAGSTSRLAHAQSSVNNILHSFREERSPLDPRRLRREGSFTSSTSKCLSHGEPVTSSKSSSPPQDVDSLYLDVVDPLNVSIDSPEAEKSSSAAINELLESKVFSHDEANSVYMSVVGEDLPEQIGVRKSPYMPGAWDEQGDLHYASSKPSIKDRSAPTMSEQKICGGPSTQMSSSSAVRRHGTPPVHLDEPRASATHAKDNKPSVLNERSTGGELISKTIVDVRHVNIMLPDRDHFHCESAQDTSTDFSTDSGANILERERRGTPGSFSTYAESASLARSQVTGIGSARKENSTLKPSQKPSQNSLDIDVGLEQIRCTCSLDDIALLVPIVKKLRNIITSSDSAMPGQSSTQQGQQVGKPTRREHCIRATLHDFHLDILDRNFKNIGQLSTTPDDARDQEHNVSALRCRETQFDFNLEDGNFKQCEFGIQKVQLDLAGQCLLRFDQEARLNSSIKDTQLLLSRDISLKYNNRGETLEINVSTLPVVIDIDALKLDETLYSIGGFSTLLEMGSSIISDVAMDERNQPRASSQGPRVHFQPHSPSPMREQSKKVQVGLKANIRLGGSSIAIRAGPRLLRYSSTAIKAVIRDGLTGIQLDDSRLFGPCDQKSSEKEDVSIRARNLSVKLLHRPEEQDLSRLISLVTPSKDNFELGDGGLMVETLICQRRNGTAARVSVSTLEVEFSSVDVFDDLKIFASDISRLGSISKYLPEETRPGLLTLVNVHTASLHIQQAPIVGDVRSNMVDLELASVSVPSLLALKASSIGLRRNTSEELIHEVLPRENSEHQAMLMVRLVGEEVIPKLEVKLMNMCAEYDVSILMDMLGITDGPHGVDALASSVMYTRDHSKSAPDAQQQSKPQLQHASSSSSMISLKVDLGIRNCALGLIPRQHLSKALIVLSDARVQFSNGKLDFSSTEIDIRKAALLLTDDRSQLLKFSASDRVPLKIGQSIPQLCFQGYVTVCWISAAHAFVVVQTQVKENMIDVEFDDQLLVLETCADSTKTLTELMSALQPPAPMSEGRKYQTEVTTVEDMMSSFAGESFPITLQREGYSRETPNNYARYQRTGRNGKDESDGYSDFPDSLPGSSHHSSLSDLTADFADESEGHFTGVNLTSGGLDPTSLPEQMHGTACKWDSDRNKYITVSRSEVLSSPFKLQVKNLHIIWNLHDGYDWRRTREAIATAHEDLEARTEEKRNKRRHVYEHEDEPGAVIGDFLFNSIYVGVPVNQDPREITRQINRNVDDTMSETGSHATTATDATARPHRLSRGSPKKLKLERSQRHKITFELIGVSADMFLYPPSQETVSSTDIRIRDFDIFDHVPTSTWKKFMTYMQDAGPREDKKPMMHIEICNVKPIPDLLASELVMRVTVLPVRLHVDQDALDFMTRFFAFENEEALDEGKKADQPYIQRVEVLPVPIKLDYKPKKVDYVGLRSGRTKEFMNFFNLDSADMVLKHAIVYGCPSFARLHSNLEDIWMPDITTKQLPSVLSGLNGVRTIVNVGSGVRNLVTIPIQEYKKDGRVFRSISKGALSFARTSGSELAKLGARLAVGAQTALQGAEEFLVKPRDLGDVDWETADLDEEEKRAFSHYATQPAGIMQGLKGAAKSLERDLLVTRDVIVAISGEARESGSIEGTARAVARNAPTIILRPMIGASKAVSQTLMGATNAVDPQNRRRLEDKYKRY